MSPSLNFNHTKPDYRAIFSTLWILLVTALMVGLSEGCENREILFPEIAALAVGTAAAPKISWKTSPLIMVSAMSIASFGGIGIVRYLACPLWIQIVLAYLICQLLMLFFHTGFAPLISAMVLPVLFQTTSLWYPVSAISFTVLILIGEKILSRICPREPWVFTPVSWNWKQEMKDLLLRLVLVMVLEWIILPLGFRFVLAPPMIVAFTEWTKRESPARSKPFLAPLMLIIGALSGTLFRYILCIQLHLPLTLAAGLAMLLLLIVLHHFRLYLPPAGAMTLLPMIVPAESLLGFPVQAAVGCFLLMFLARVLFRTPKEEC